MVEGGVIEECSRTNVVYMGSTNTVGYGQEPRKEIQVTALKMASSGLEIQDLFTISSANYPTFDCITCMVSHPAPNKQEFLLVGGNMMILVLKLGKSYQFEHFFDLKVICGGSIYDVELANLNLFCAASDTSFIPVVSLPNKFSAMKKIDFTRYQVESFSLGGADCRRS